MNRALGPRLVLFTNCLEGKFSEVRLLGFLGELRLYRILGTSWIEAGHSPNIGMDSLFVSLRHNLLILRFSFGGISIPTLFNN
jgi:hypothetical protein